MLAKVILLVLGLFILWQIAIRIFRKCFHFPAPAFLGRLLDSSLRRRGQPPDKVIERSGIKEGMYVLDLGCGSGALATFAARAVGEKGKVYALDVQPKMLSQLENKLSRPENRDIKNVELINGNAYQLPFDNDSLDLVYMVTVLEEIPDRSRALAEVKRVLKQGGILAVTELLPDPDYPLMSTTIRRGKDAGFLLDGTAGNFWNYTVRFRKPLIGRV